MNEYPQNPQSEQPNGSLEGIQDAHDAISEQLPERLQTERGVDWLLDRQKELYELHQQKRENEEQLSSEEEQELDDINHALLELSHVLEKYQPEE